jgi:hypothetical protein
MSSVKKRVNTGRARIRTSVGRPEVREIKSDAVRGGAQRLTGGLAGTSEASGGAVGGRKLEVLHGLLHLVGYCCPPAVLEKRTARALKQAERWAAREHLSASDNPVRRLQRPEWLGAFEAEECLQHATPEELLALALRPAFRTVPSHGSSQDRDVALSQLEEAQRQRDAAILRLQELRGSNRQNAQLLSGAEQHLARLREVNAALERELLQARKDLALCAELKLGAQFVAEADLSAAENG